jgi:hypothetical protein
MCAWIVDVLGQDVLGQDVLGQDVLGQDVLGQDVLLGQDVPGLLYLQRRVYWPNASGVPRRQELWYE